MDPIWKRSGFTAAILSTLAIGLRWAIDGQTPTTDGCLEVAALWLAVIGFAAYRPTMRADQPR